MIFNKIIRGAQRERNEQEHLESILDNGFLCHVAFQHKDQTMIIPTAYGRCEEFLYLHGSTKNFMLNQIINGQTLCISVTHLDGIVLARSLFHTSVNYRSLILFGKAILVTDEKERMDGMKCITENIVKGRWNEVKVGDENQLKATMVVKFIIESASVKIRSDGPAGDESITDQVWSGTIPLVMKALTPLQDPKFGVSLNLCDSVKAYYEQNK